MHPVRRERGGTAMDSTTARAIWNGLSREIRQQAASALWSDDQIDRGDRARALVPWLAARGLRYQYLEKLPRARRATLMAEGGVPEETAQQLLISFHLVHRRDLLSAFLDALGIDHEDGLISAEADLEPATDEAVSKAVAAVEESHPEDDVALYLRTLAATDPVTWAAVVRQLGPAS